MSDTFSETTHIVSAFDKDLNSIQSLITDMGQLAEAAIGDAIQALSENDPALAATVCEQDARIDALDETINSKVIQILALRSPMASDLRMVLSVLKISANLERVGDYAKNVARRVDILSSNPPIEGVNSALRRLARDVQNMLNTVLRAYVGHDIDLANQVRNHDVEVDEMYNTLLRDLLTRMMEQPRTISACMHLNFVAKNIERAGDHVTSIAEQVIYMVTGAYPTQDRPKGDWSKLNIS